MLTKLLTSLVTRDVEAFVNFVEHLRDKLDALIIRHWQRHRQGAGLHRRDSRKRLLPRSRRSRPKRRPRSKTPATTLPTHEVLAAETEIAKIKAKIERVKNAVSAVSAI
jgi:hypothetical protein